MPHAPSQVAVELQEADCLDWLRVVLEQGSAILKVSCNGDVEDDANVQDRVLLWLLEVNGAACASCSVALQSRACSRGLVWVGVGLDWVSQVVPEGFA